MEFTHDEIQQRDDMDMLQQEYEHHMDMQAAKRVMRKASIEELNELLAELNMRGIGLTRFKIN